MPLAIQMLNIPMKNGVDIFQLTRWFELMKKASLLHDDVYWIHTDKDFFPAMFALIGFETIPEQKAKHIAFKEFTHKKKKKGKKYASRDDYYAYEYSYEIFEKYIARKEELMEKFYSSGPKLDISHMLWKYGTDGPHTMVPKDVFDDFLCQLKSFVARVKHEVVWDKLKAINSVTLHFDGVGEVQLLSDEDLVKSVEKAVARK